MYINVQGTKNMRLGEIVSMRVTVFNLCSEEMDVLVSVKSSKNYDFVDINADATANSTSGDLQVT